MKKLLPILLIVLGIGGGIGAGLALKPAPQTVHLEPCGDAMPVKKEEPEEKEEDPSDHEFVKLNNQFVVPVVTEERVQALVVLSLSVEMTSGAREIVFLREPKLRDVFLQVLFDHANIGGFRGAFTNSNNMDMLRNALREAGSNVLGSALVDVLIVDIARQDT